MKKAICLILLSMFLPLAGFCTENQSNNSFEIPIASVPPGSPPGSSSSRSGLSGGAVTAIALGSAFGGLAALGGAAYYFAHKGLPLREGQVIGQNNPVCAICIDNVFLEKLKSNPSKYNYLTCAIEKNGIKSCDSAKYLVVQDMSVKNNTFNSVHFALPESLKGKNLNVKITQISMPYKMNEKLPELDTKILLDNKAKTPAEIALFTSEITPQNGILEKKGNFNSGASNRYVLTTSYNSLDKKASSLTYGVLVEFFDAAYK